MLKASIDLKQIKTNIQKIKNDSKKDIIVVSKSNCYNAGAVVVTKYLYEQGIKYFAVVDILEAKELITNEFCGQILVLNSVSLSDLDYCNNHDNIIITINSLEEMDLINAFSWKRIIDVHIQIDTGMNRIGFKSVDEVKTIITKLSKNNKVNIQGIYTHFTSLANLSKQEKLFSKYLSLYNFKMIHAGATPTYKDTTIGNFVRVGLDVYGDNPDNQAISIYTKPIAINSIKKGESVGYNETWVALNDTTICVIPIGYNDGYQRRNKNSTVLINDRIYNIVGNVCMNHAFIEVDKQVNINDKVYLTCKNNCANKIANHLGTISYEVYCLMKIKEWEYVK